MSHHRRGDLPALRLFVIVGLSCVALGVVPYGSVQAQVPALILSPSAAQPGMTITVEGNGFPASATGAVIWSPDGTPLASVTADAAGAFVAPVVVPDVPPGAYTIIA